MMSPHDKAMDVLNAVKDKAKPDDGPGVYRYDIRRLLIAQLELSLSSFPTFDPADNPVMQAPPIYGGSMEAIDDPSP